ncbi:MAG: gamma-glutamyltransferase [Bacteroidetes bacterium]|nr:gamma-glutamyltransferase [Bacteroidota bacterium]
MVVSADSAASQAGLTMLQRGGNAIDAAVATGFALAVTYPIAGNLGGGGFLVLRQPDGTATTIDYREKAPRAATRDMYLDARGNAVPERSRRGHLASGVPGSPAGLLLAHSRYGSLPLDTVMAPAIRLAEDGFLLSDRQADRFNAQRETFLDFSGTARYFTRPDSTRYAGGDRFRQPDLAEVLRRIRDEGRAGFYRGATADLIVAEMERGGGLISHEDLQAYEAVERPPITGRYRGHRILSMGPPSSGGVAVVQLLNAIAPYDIAEMGFLTDATIHLMGEAERRVYADRAEWLGDADFVDVPVDALTHPAYMRQRMATFEPDRVTPTDSVSHGDPLALETMETTHYSVVDSAGQAVSVTTTINGAYGSKVVVDGAGFFLNNEMDDFSVKPGVPNMYGLVGSEANAIEPEKRMLSSMSPTIVEDPEGRLFLVIGTPGGATIITTVFQVIQNVIDHGMNMQAAVAAPRVHHQWKPDDLRHEPDALTPAVADSLRARGWTLNERGPWGRADGIRVQYDADGTRIYEGGADPRGEDVALGY